LARSSLRDFVPDASVAVKWFVDEKYSERARALLGEYAEGRLRLFAPSLVEYEVANALRYHPLIQVSDAQIVQAVAALRGAQIPISPTIAVWSKALELSRSHVISVYDAVYIAVALAAAAICVTADDELIRMLGKEVSRVVVHIRHLVLSSSSEGGAL